jgi:polyphenol oxidase
MIGRRPQWAAPSMVGALMTGREGGVSVGAFRSLNIGSAVGDDPASVVENRARVAAATGARPVWLRQVHGARVLRVGAWEAEVSARGAAGQAADAGSDGATRPVADAGRDDAAGLVADAGRDDTARLVADAAWTDEPGIACTAQVADCLPVLFATLDGRGVAAAHAGWRGLAAGVLEATLAALCGGTGRAPSEVAVWLGPCIGPREFEVGADVLEAFGASPLQADPLRFVSRPRDDGEPRWRANLQQLALDRLQSAGVVKVAADRGCTVEDASGFFSFRRDGVTGRMVAAVWLAG